MKILIASTKGGVGKSTIAREMCAMQILDKNKTTLVELDSANRSHTRHKSDMSITNLKHDEVDVLIADFLLSDECTIVDMGVENCSSIINQFLEFGAIDFFDVIIIPLCKDVTSTDNALITAKEILSRSSNDNIFFCLNRRDPNKKVQDDFSYFFDSAHEFNKMFNTEILSKIIEIPENSLFPESHELKTTIGKLANSELDLIKMAKEAKNNGKKEKARELIRQDMKRKSGQSIFRHWLKPAFEKISSEEIEAS